MRCEFGCTKKWPLCHKFFKNDCRVQHYSQYCKKGYHVKEGESTPPADEPAEKRQRRATALTERRFHTPQETEKKQDERPQTPELSETEGEQRKRGRYHEQSASASSSAEADLQIALARLNFDEMPDMATLEYAYQQKMIEFPRSTPSAEIAAKGSELTWAFKHIGRIIKES